MSEGKKNHRMKQLIAAVIGTVITWALNNMVGVDAVLASASVALCGGLVLKKYHGIFMAGTFAGMSGLGAVPGWSWACMVGVIVFLLWVATEKIMAGVGGKYGWTACWSGFGAQFIIIPIRISMGLATASAWNNVFFNTGAFNAWFIAQPWNIPLCIILSCIGAVATIWLRNKIITPLWGIENTTVASALVGLFGFLIIWTPMATFEIFLTGSLSPEGPTLTIAPKLGAFVYMGSFAGMASKKRIRWEGKSDILAFAIVGIITGCIFFIARMILPYGGLYGWTAAVGVMTYDFVFAKLILREEKHDLRTFAAIQK